VENVDGCEAIVELDGVEQDRRGLDFNDVAQMKITVAMAHVAAAGARLEQRRKPRQAIAACRGERL
jgi:hypothetical protein